MSKKHPSRDDLFNRQQTVLAALVRRIDIAIGSDLHNETSNRWPWAEYVDGEFILDRHDVAEWAVDHSANKAMVEWCWSENEALFEDRASSVHDFRDVVIEAHAEEEPHLRDAVEQKPWFVVLNIGARAYRDRLLNIGRSVVETLGGFDPSGRADRRVVDQWPAFELEVARRLGLNTYQTSAVIHAWIDADCPTNKR